MFVNEIEKKQSQNMPMETDPCTLKKDEAKVNAFIT